MRKGRETRKRWKGEKGIKKGNPNKKLILKEN